MLINYYSMNEKECIVKFYITNTTDCNYDFYGYNGDFICDFLNRDYSALYYFGPKGANNIKRTKELRKRLTEIEQEIFEISNLLGENINMEYVEKTYYEEMEEKLAVIENLTNAVDFNMYKKLVDEVLLNKDKYLNAKQRLAAYELSTRNDSLLNFHCFAYVNSDITYRDETYLNYYSEILNIANELPMKNRLQKVKEYIKENNIAFETYFTYDFNDYESLLKFITYMMIKNNDFIKLCRNCNRYFYPANRSDTLYCDNASPQDNSKSCKEYGAIKTYQDNLKSNEIMGLYRKIYMQKQMLSKRNPDIKEYANDFENYKLMVKQWKNDIKKELKTEEEYLLWLKSLRKNESD